MTGRSSRIAASALLLATLAAAVVSGPAAGLPHAAEATTTTATTSATTAAAAANAGAGGALFERRDDDALMSLAASEPPAWLGYQALVLSRARATPLLLFFDDDGVDADSCRGSSGSQEEATDGDGEDDGGDQGAPLGVRECSGERSALLSAALGGVARAFAHAGLQVVRVPASQLPQMLRYHRVTTRPSLLWLAPRSARNFQRFPHPETNALDLTSPAKLLEVLQTQQQQQQQQQQRRSRRSTPPTPAPSAAGSNTADADADAGGRATAAPTPEQQLTAVLCEVVRAWFVKSGLAPASSARTGAVPPAAAAPALPVPGAPDGLATAEFIPVLGLLAFVGAVAHDKRELLLRTLRGRFVWFVWSLGVTYAAYSGAFHSLIHGMPLLYVGAHHGLLLFHPSGRRQFVLEGLLSGAWSFLVSLGAFSVAEVLPMERSRAARSEVFVYSVVIAGAACTILHATFMAKTPWLSS